MTIKEFLEYAKELGLDENTNIYSIGSCECGNKYIFDKYSMSTTRIGGFEGKLILCLHQHARKY